MQTMAPGPGHLHIIFNREIGTWFPEPVVFSTPNFDVPAYRLNWMTWSSHPRSHGNLRSCPFNILETLASSAMHNFLFNYGRWTLKKPHMGKGSF